jgi:hypothetical protein
MDVDRGGRGDLLHSDRRIPGSLRACTDLVG